jgi:hypothetical protein
MLTTLNLFLIILVAILVLKLNNLNADYISLMTEFNKLSMPQLI